MRDTAGHVASVFAQHVGFFPQKICKDKLYLRGVHSMEKESGRICPSPTFFLPMGPNLWRVDSLYFCIVSFSSWWAQRRPQTISCSMALHPLLTIMSDSIRVRANMQGVEAMLAQHLSLDCPARVLPWVTAGLGGGSGCS